MFSCTFYLVASPCGAVRPQPSSGAVGPISSAAHLSSSPGLIWHIPGTLHMVGWSTPTPSCFQKRRFFGHFFFSIVFLRRAIMGGRVGPSPHPPLPGWAGVEPSHTAVAYPLPRPILPGGHLRAVLPPGAPAPDLRPVHLRRHAVQCALPAAVHTQKHTRLDGYASQVAPPKYTPQV